MNPRRWGYRARQFFFALRATPTPSDLELARGMLPPEQFDLFREMQPSEQAHSVGMLRRLQAQGESNPHLLAAALLHDVGKTRFPLQVWERVLIVLSRALFPRQARQWGQGAPHGWRRAFSVAEQHPAWGGEMAAAAGASALTVELICQHQSMITGNLSPTAQALLHKLQAVDDAS